MRHLGTARPSSVIIYHQPASCSGACATHGLDLAAPEVGVLDARGQRADAELAGQPHVAAVLGRLLQHAVAVDDHARDETLEVVGTRRVAAADRHQRRRVEHVVLVTCGPAGGRGGSESRDGAVRGRWRGAVKWPPACDLSSETGHRRLIVVLGNQQEAGTLGCCCAERIIFGELPLSFLTRYRTHSQRC